jgi:hypothetical protein
MRRLRRVRRLVVDGATWHWTVRQRLRPAYEDCRLTLTFFAPSSSHRPGRRLSLVFAPTPTGVISHCYFDSGTVIRLPDRHWLNLYEPGAAARLLKAAAPALELHASQHALTLDGWPCFSEVVTATTREGTSAPGSTTGTGSGS